MRSEAVAVPVGQLKLVASSDVLLKASSYVTEAQSVTELPFYSHNIFDFILRNLLFQLLTVPVLCFLYWKKSLMVSLSKRNPCYVENK